MESLLGKIFKSDELEIQDNFFALIHDTKDQYQALTNKAFSEKWTDASKSDTMERTLESQKKWFCSLYGFDSEEDFRRFLRSRKIIFDAGCGLGYKTAWFAELSPKSLVIGMDYSDAVEIAAKIHKKYDNLFFIRGDISNTGLKPESIDFINCDQVIHHTTNPSQTFRHLTERLKKDGQFNCYVYAKKGLPRELLDDYFREHVSEFTEEEIWELSEQLTQLGRTISELDIKIKVPDIPLLQIKGGEYDIQRFLYWNFLKCYWNEKFGFKASVLTNFDWYAPKNAFRYSLEEFKKMVHQNNLEIIHLHSEEACHSGRFKKK